MAAATRVLPCDADSISFPNDAPHIASEETRQAISAAADHLKALQTVVFPTETVYGLGALATNSSASSRIFSTKGRPPDNPLIVHVSSESMLQALLPPGYTLPPTYPILIRRFWPGPLTLLFPRDSTKVPDIITAGQKTVAVRMPSHPVARALIAFTGIPLAAPSANSSGKPSPTTAQHVTGDLGGKLGIILDGGPCDVGVESTVVDGLADDGHLRVLRPGGVTVEQIEGALREEHLGQDHRVLVHKRDYSDKTLEEVPTTPGMKYRHYSPSVPVVLLQTRSPNNGAAPSTKAYLTSLLQTNVAPGPFRVGVLCLDDSPFGRQVQALQHPHLTIFSLGSANDLSVAARRLFDGLISLEQQGVHFMVIEEVEEQNEGLAVMNRVRKAASKTQWIDTTK